MFMKKLMVLILFIIVSCQLNAQTIAQKIVQQSEDTISGFVGKIIKETKYDKFISTYGAYVQFFDYKLPINFRTKDEQINATIRIFIDLNTKKKTSFLCLRSYSGNIWIGKIATAFEIIEYSDLLKIIDSIPKLKECTNLIPNKDVYMETKFITEDGFEIGFYKENAKHKNNWFIAMRYKYEDKWYNHRIYLKEDSDIETAFMQAKEKMEELMYY